MSRTIIIILGITCAVISFISCHGCISSQFIKYQLDRRNGVPVQSTPEAGVIMAVVGIPGDLIISQQLADRQEGYDSTKRNNLKITIFALDILLTYVIDIIFFGEPPKLKPRDEFFRPKDLKFPDEKNKAPEQK